MLVKTQHSNLLIPVWSAGIGTIHGNVCNYRDLQGLKATLFLCFFLAEPELLVSTKTATLSAPSVSHIPHLTLLIPQQSKKKTITVE